MTCRRQDFPASITAGIPRRASGRLVMLVFYLGVAALFAARDGFAQTGDALRYARGFLVTGNYRVGGVDLPASGGAGTINFDVAHANEVPASVDLLAAYLYWETITRSTDPLPSAIFRGTAVRAAKVTSVSPLPGSGASCWGSAGGSTSVLAMFRADVLSLLPKRIDANGKWTGKYLVNDTDLIANDLPLHTVTLPQAGTGNVLTQSAGATLVLVYRDPSEPLRKILVYEGAYAQPQGTTTTQMIRGLYKSAATASASITHIVGGGAANTNERLLVNGSVIATDPFPGPTVSSDRAWSNRTFDVTSSMPGTNRGDGYGETVTTSVDHGAANDKTSPYDCLAWAGVILSAAVADIDRDGIPDGIEDDPAGLNDPPTPAYPNGQPLPNLRLMGGGSDHRDLFVEVNAMWAPGADPATGFPGTSYGSVNAPYNSTTSTAVDSEGHNHLPTPEVLKLVGDAYAAHGITPHFDVGDPAAYHARGAEYACPDPIGHPECNADPYLVPATLARGGEAIRERACASNGTISCQFPDYPGTVGWRLGPQAYKGAPVADDGSELTTAEIMATWRGGTHRRRFDRVREQFFHYLLYAHARGSAKSSMPCLDSAGQPTGYDPSTKSCASGDNPLFHVPSSASGVSDLPGNTALITLGLWDNFRGTTFVQASTTLHELGHQLELWHGGAPAIWGDRNTPTQVEPNCKPNYLSSMSYLFQVHGLRDNSGGLHLDYSGLAHGAIDETSPLTDAALFGANYVPAWFAPAGSPLASLLGASTATRFCSGSKFDLNAPPAPMARVSAATSDDTIDWNGDGSVGPSAAQDVNFDGAESPALLGHDDWASIRLDQIGAGRHVQIVSSANGDLLDFGSGDVVDFGSGDVVDFGSGDFLTLGSGTYFTHFGSGDLIDFGSGDVVDFGSGDLIDFGSGNFLDMNSGDVVDFGSGDLIDFGSGDLIDYGSGDLIDFGSGAGTQELDYDAARAMGRTSPSTVHACIVGRDTGCLAAAPNTALYHRVQVRWTAAAVGHVYTNHVYRVTGNSVTASSTVVELGSTSGTTFVDTEELPNGVEFTYFVKAEFDDQTPHTFSGASNFTVITAVNDPPSVANDNDETDAGSALHAATSGVLGNDSDDDSPIASLTAVLSLAPSHGSLTLNADGSFVYTPNVGFSGTDTFTYKTNDGPWSRDVHVPLSSDSNEATVTITVRPVLSANHPPECYDIVSSVKTGGSVTLSISCKPDADGDRLTVTSVSAATPAALGNVSLNSDGSFTYTAQSPNVGGASFTYTVSDGKGGIATAKVTMSVVYGFGNVQNLPPSAGKTFSRSGTVAMKWQWTNSAGTSIDSSLADPEVMVSVVSTSGNLPPGWNSAFTVQNPGSGDSWGLPTAKNGYTWQFNWKLTYTASDGRLYELPAGTYLVRIKSRRTGQLDPNFKNSDGQTGAEIVVK